MVALSDSISLEMRDAVRIVQAVVAESNGLIIRKRLFLCRFDDFRINAQAPSDDQ